ncbi:hypothetical protein ABK040_013136 [Willaertia magna]
MKRRENEISDLSQKPELKMQKIDNTFFKSLLKLSNDEFYLILNYLNIGEIILFAITCKDFYNKITNTLQQYHPTFIYFTYPQDDEENNENKVKREPKWTIMNTLRSFNKIIVNDETLPKLFQLQKENDLSKITKKYEIDNEIIDCNFENVIKLFSTETNLQRTIDVINLDLKDLKNYNFYNNKKTITVKDKLGFNIKNLTIKNYQNGKQLELYSLLSQFYSLEYLTVFYELGYSRRKFNVLYNLKDNISLPIMYNLKNLYVDILDEEGNQNKIITEIVQLAPNLEKIKFDTYCSIDDKLLNVIAKSCPKLKEFDGDEVDTLTTVTDKNLLNFLKELPNLTYLALRHCNNISGLLFKEIGKYGKNLKHFGITREDEDAIDLEDDIYFGGGELPNLESFYIDRDFELFSNKFVETLFKNAPNLKKISGLYKFVKSFDKFNFKNLQSVEISQKDLERVFEAKDLKSLTIRMEKLSITKEIIYNLLRYFPNLEELNYIFNHRVDDSLSPEAKEALIEILKNPMNWPNLRVCQIGDKGLEWKDLVENNIARPSLKTRWAEWRQIKSDNIDFVRSWLLDGK